MGFFRLSGFKRSTIGDADALVLMLSAKALGRCAADFFVRYKIWDNPVRNYLNNIANISFINQWLELV